MIWLWTRGRKGTKTIRWGEELMILTRQGVRIDIFSRKASVRNCAPTRKHLVLLNYPFPLTVLLSLPLPTLISSSSFSRHLSFSPSLFPAITLPPFLFPPSLHLLRYLIFNHLFLFAVASYMQWPCLHSFLMISLDVFSSQSLSFNVKWSTFTRAYAACIEAWRKYIYNTSISNPELFLFNNVNN